MKLLLDENLSDRAVEELIDLYPGSSHVKMEGFIRTDDSLIWEYAKLNGFGIVTKDWDFHQRSLVFGPPPKIIFLRLGNSPTSKVINLLRSHHQTIDDFEDDPHAGLLMLGD